MRVPGLVLPCLWVTLTAALFACTSCSDRPRTIAFIPETSGTELWESAHARAAVMAQAAGYSLYWNAAAREDDVQRQVALVSNLDPRKLAGLILAPTNSLALLSAIAKFTQAQKPIAILRSPLPISPSRNIHFIVNDEDMTGRLIAERVHQKFGAQARLVVVGMDRTSPQKFERLKALNQHLAAISRGLIIVDVREGGNEVTDESAFGLDILSKSGRVDCIVALDSLSTQAALTAKRAISALQSTLLIGCDQDLDLMLGLRTGVIDSIVAENSKAMAQLAVEYIQNFPQGAASPSKTTTIPLLISRENIDSPEAQRILSLEGAI